MIFYCLWVLILNYYIGNSEGLPPKSVNLNLETVLEFDKVHNKQDLELIDGIQRLLAKIKQVITTNARRNNVNIKFSDYLVKTIDLLTKMGDSQVKAIFQALKEQLKKNEYKHTKIAELLDNDELRNVITRVIEKLSKASPRAIREWLASAKNKIQNKRSKAKGLLEYIDALYGTEDLKKFEELIKTLEIFKDSKRKSVGDLKLVVNGGLKSVVFDHYSHLSDNTRRSFKVWLDYFVNDLNFGDPEKESEKTVVTATKAPFFNLFSNSLGKQIGRAGSPTQQLKNVYNFLKDNVLQLQEITFTNENDNPLLKDKNSDKDKLKKKEKNIKKNKKHLKHSEDEIPRTTKLYAGETTEEENYKYTIASYDPYKTRSEKKDDYDDAFESEHEDEQIKLKVHKRSKKTKTPVSTTKKVSKKVIKSYEEDYAENTSSDFEEKWTTKHKKSKKISPAIPRTTKSRAHPIRIHKKVQKTSEEDAFEETSSDVEESREKRTTKNKKPRPTKRANQFKPIRIHKKVPKTEEDFTESSSDIEDKRTTKNSESIETTSKKPSKVNTIRIIKRVKKESDEAFEETSSDNEEKPTIKKKAEIDSSVWKANYSEEDYKKVKDSSKEDNKKTKQEDAAENDPLVRDSFANDDTNKNGNKDANDSDDGVVKNKEDDAKNSEKENLSKDIKSLFKIEIFSSTERTSKKSRDSHRRYKQRKNKKIEDICNNMRRNEPDSGTGEGLSIEAFYSNDTHTKANNNCSKTDTNKDKEANLPTTTVAVDIVTNTQPNIEINTKNEHKSKEATQKYLSQRRNSIVQIPLEAFNSNVVKKVTNQDEIFDNKEKTTTIAEIVSTTVENHKFTSTPLNGKNKSDDLIANETLDGSTEPNNVIDITQTIENLQIITKPDLAEDNSESLNSVIPDNDRVASKEVTFDYDVNNQTQHDSETTTTTKVKEASKEDLKKPDDLKDLKMDFLKGGHDFEVNMR